MDGLGSTTEDSRGGQGWRSRTASTPTRVTRPPGPGPCRTPHVSRAHPRPRHPHHLPDPPTQPTPRTGRGLVPGPLVVSTPSTRIAVPFRPHRHHPPTRPHPPTPVSTSSSSPSTEEVTTTTSATATRRVTNASTGPVVPSSRPPPLSPFPSHSDPGLSDLVHVSLPSTLSDPVPVPVECPIGVRHSLWTRFLS